MATAAQHVASQLDAAKDALAEGVVPLGELMMNDQLDASLRRWAQFRVKELDALIQNIDALLEKARSEAGIPA